MEFTSSPQALSEASICSCNASELNIRDTCRSIPISPISTASSARYDGDLTSPMSCLTNNETSPFSRLAIKRAHLAQQRSRLDERFSKAAGHVHALSSSDRDHALVERLRFACSNGRCSYLYTGPIHSESKLPHGVGEMRYANGQVYKGNLHHGLRHGYGENTWPRNDKEQQVYRGAWEDDSRHGRGTHEWIDISDGRNTRFQYATGYWKNGHLHGRVCMVWRDGSSYDGDVVHGKKHGRGVQTWKSGKVYSGQYRDGVENGYGTLTDVEKHVTYRGNFEAGKRHGAGVQIWRNKTYDGQWENNVIQGQGKLVWKNGSKYTGHFKKGMYDGDGCIMNSQGNKYIGTFRDGKKDGIGREYFLNGDKYSGAFIQGRRHGYGRFTYADGSMFAGGWFKGKKSGRGILVSADGKVEHYGRFTDDERLSSDTNSDYKSRDNVNLTSSTQSMLDGDATSSSVSRVVLIE